MKKFLYTFYFVSVVLIANFLFFIFSSAKPFILIEDEVVAQEEDVTIEPRQENAPPEIPEVENIVEEEKVEEVATPVIPAGEDLTPRNVLVPVPFTTQAPFGDWSEEIFQDGCEEANILMAVRWARKVTLTPEEAHDEIVAISSFEKKEIGDFRDASIADTAKVMGDYFSFTNFLVKNNVSKLDIINELLRGNIVIAPMNGQKLGNPFYTPPGPINHMLTIIGYDAARKEFIVNDSGTKRGSKYRYAEDVLYNSLRDYPTGFQEENIKEEKNIIVIKPEV